MDRLDAMSVLLAAAESGSLSGAGRKLRLPLATVSRKVSELESHLKASLLIRSSKGLDLTPAGRAFVAAAKAILEQVHEAERAAGGEYVEPKGDLVATAPTMFGRLHLLPVVLEFLSAYPAVSVGLMLTDRVTHFLDDQIDVALRIGSLPDSDLIATRVGSLRRVVCASPDYFATRGAPRAPADLERHSLIAFAGVSETSVWTFWSGDREITAPFRSRLSVTTIEAAIDASLAGAGLVRAMSYQVSDHVRGGRLATVLEGYEPPPPPVHLVYGRQNRLPLKLRVLWTSPCRACDRDWKPPRSEQTRLSKKRKGWSRHERINSGKGLSSMQSQSPMPANTAAWSVSPGAKLSVGPAPYTPPAEGEIVIRGRAVAINPVDWALASLPFISRQVAPWMKHPAVLGEDVAGEVAEVGAGVTRFKPGERVVAFAAGGNQNRSRAAEGAFQTYVVALAHMASPIPDALSFEDAAVLPLGLSTAACGLFQKDFLALQHPSTDARPTGKTLLIWGGATSVGCNAIQLAANSGYEVFTTASPHNADYLVSLGATRVFDYRREGVAREIVEAFKGKTIAGALAIATGSTGKCLDIVRRSEGDKFVAIAAGPISLGDVGAGGLLQVLPHLPKMLLTGLFDGLKARSGRIGTKFIWGGSLVDNEVGPAVFVDFLPRALAEGRFVAAPPAVVVGAGLEAIETGFEAQRKGVSARKVVVSLGL